MPMAPALQMAALVALAVAGTPAALAQGFEAQISPPRFEDGTKPGTVYREVIEISNPGQTPTRLSVSTADWVFDDDGAARFTEALATGSCRPWTALEATSIEVPAGGRRRFRFEVRVPADAPDGQCRFGVMFEGEPTPMPGMVMPVAGRIGVIVYLDIGKASAALRVVGGGKADVGGQTLPTIRVENTGNAHGRLSGLIDALDAAGKRWTLSPSSLPILPGATRDIPLAPVLAEGEQAMLAFPLELKGRLDWRDQRIDIDTRAGQ